MTLGELYEVFDGDIYFKHDNYTSLQKYKSYVHQEYENRKITKLEIDEDDLSLTVWLERIK